MDLKAWGHQVQKKLAQCVQDACRINACRFSAGSVTVLSQVPNFPTTSDNHNNDKYRYTDRISIQQFSACDVNAA